MNEGGVLLVANYPSDVGYAWWLMETYWASIAERLAAKGRRCILAYPQVSRLPAVIAAAPLEVVQLPWPQPGWRKLAIYLRFIRTRRISALYLTDRPVTDWRYALFKLAGVRRIVIHDHSPGDRPRKGGLKGACSAALNRVRWLSCDRAIGVTEFVCHRLVENARFPARRCRTVPNGIPSTPLPTSAERRLARDILNLERDSVAVGIVSRAHRYKNWSFAIKVAAVLAKSPQGKHLVWVFCGDGPDLPFFRHEAHVAGITGRCRFLGRRTDVSEICAGLDIGMHPSLGEVGYSLSILELMRAGLPVVVPNLPSVCGATLDGWTGLHYRAGDTEAAANVIQRLVEQPALRHRLGSAARLEVEQRFSLDAALEALGREVVDFL